MASPWTLTAVDLEDNYLLDDRLRIVRRLGEGGFGTVYEARDEQLNRQVAVKILKNASLHDVSSRKRFMREGKILAQVQSENLVRLFSVKISAAGFLYMVMELVAGISLRTHLFQTEKLSEKLCLQVALGVARALQALASHGVVHRDLKPDNIMILQVEGQDTIVKVLDFGLSGLVNRENVKDSYATTSGTILGSIHYIAPELCLGQKGTFQSDCYALGCILYECITGTPPFHANDPAAIAFKHVSESPADPLDSVPELSPGLRSLVSRLLEKSPTNRFQNANELVHTVESCIAGESFGLAAPTQFDVPQPRKASPNRMLLGSLAGLLFALLVGAGAYYSSSRPMQLVAPKHVERGTTNIYNLAEIICAQQPAEGLDYLDCKKKLEELEKRSSQDNDAITSLKQKLGSCDANIDRNSISLLDLLNKRHNGLTDPQIDLILKVVARLRAIGKAELCQQIVGAAIACLVRDADERNIVQRRFQITSLITEYAKDHNRVDQDILESTGKVQAVLFSQIPQDTLDLVLSLNLYILQASQGSPDSMIRSNLLKALERAGMDSLRKTSIALNMATTKAFQHKDKEVATVLVKADRKVFETLAPKTQFAEMCYAWGNGLASCGSAAAPDYWKIAAEAFEHGAGKAEYRIGAFINYGAYLLGRKQPGDAVTGTKFIWAAFAVIGANKTSEQLKLAWFQAAPQLPADSDRSRVCDLLKAAVEGRGAGSFALSTPVNIFKANLIEADILTSLGRMKEAELCIQQTVELAKHPAIDPADRFDALSWQARIFSSSPQGPKFWNELLNDPYVTHVPRDKLSRLYEEAYHSHAAPLERGKSKVESAPSNAEFLQKAFELSGMSADWSRRCARVWCVADTFRSRSGAQQIEALLRDPETSKLQSSYLAQLKTLQVQCLMNSGDAQRAKEVFERMSSEQQKPISWFAPEIYLQLHETDKAISLIEKSFLAKGTDAQFSKQYARGYVLFWEGRPDEAVALLEPMASSISTKMIDKDQRRYFLILLDKCKAHSSNRDQIIKLLDKANAESKMTDFEYKHNLASILSYNSLYLDEAARIQQELARTFHSQSMRPCDKRLLYHELACMQRALNRKADAAASEKLAESFK